MGKFLDIQPVKTDLRSNLNKLITRSEIEFVIIIIIIKLLANKISGPDGFIEEFYQTYKEEITLILLKCFQKIEEEFQRHSMKPP